MRSIDGGLTATAGITGLLAAMAGLLFILTAAAVVVGGGGADLAFSSTWRNAANLALKLGLLVWVSSASAGGGGRA